MGVDMTSGKDLGKRRLIEILAFVSGAAVLVLEIAGARMLAPAFGTSIFVWTAQICTVLVALALGYYHGGKHADSEDRMAQASKMFLYACASLSISLFLSNVVLLGSAVLGAKIGPFVFSAFLFFAPCFFAGAITPIFLREYVGGMDSVGNDAGKIYAISTIGSLAGALLSAYLIVPFIGAKAGILITAAVFGALSFSAKWKLDLDRVAVLAILMLSITSLVQATSLFVPAGYVVTKEYDSEYFHFRIAENSTFKLLMLDADAHSMIKKGDSGLALPYTRQMAYATDAYLNLSGGAEGKKVAMLGLGAGTLARHTAMEGAATTVYEIDPAVLSAAKQEFEFPEMKNLQVHIGDARELLSADTTAYDALLIDAFASKFSIPVHLATKEAFATYKKSVGSGLLVINIISAADGKRSEVFRSISSTAREGFPYQFAMLSSNDTKAVQNIILVASATPFSADYMENARLNQIVAGTWEEGAIYTDERSSIDYAMMDVLE
jgi:spermidine synthase